MEATRPWRAQRQSGISEVEAAVFAATDRLLERMSIGELSVAQIVKEANISRTSFYYYFTSKYAVIAALLDSLQDALASPFEPLFEAASAGGEPTRNWRPLLEALARIYESHAPVIRAAMEHWHELPELRDAWRTSIDRSAGLVANLIDHQRTNGVALPGLDSMRLGRTVVQAVQQAWYEAGLEQMPDMEVLIEVSEPIFVMLNATLYGPE
jgi:AcrR family transcriptional regulator